MEVIWSRGATRQVERIAAYIARDSPDNAGVVVNRLYAAADLLGSQPSLGEATDVQNVRFWKVPNVPHRIFYRVRPRAGRVTILRVVHGRQLRTPPLNQ